MTAKKKNMLSLLSSCKVVAAIIKHTHCVISKHKQARGQTFSRLPPLPFFFSPFIILWTLIKFRIFKWGALFLRSGLNRILLEKHKQATGPRLGCNTCRVLSDAQCCGTNLSLASWTSTRAKMVPKSDGKGGSDTEMWSQQQDALSRASAWPWAAYFISQCLGSVK